LPLGLIVSPSGRSPVARSMAIGVAPPVVLTEAL
jgi:hypothetical protein